MSYAEFETMCWWFLLLFYIGLELVFFFCNKLYSFTEIVTLSYETINKMQKVDKCTLLFIMINATNNMWIITGPGLLTFISLIKAQRWNEGH